MSTDTEHSPSGRLGSLCDWVRTVPKFICILIGIVAVGIFLRAYHFHDWLRFNADQSRDAGVASDSVQGTGAYPLLGPKAGGTEFKLGGAFYSLQILSAQVFGNSPDKMAYPDLFASIATIPLLFLLLRRVFRQPVALLLTAILSVSVFAIKYARFAWNPNSGPFYSILFLYALLLLAEEQTKRRWLWAIVAGVGLGIGVQLHTLLLIIMPVTVFGFFIFIGRKRPTLWRQAGIVLLVALALNTGQIVEMRQTNGSNIKAFFGGTASKTAKGHSILGNVLDDATCQIQGDAFIVSGLGNDDQCGSASISDTYQKTKGIAGKLAFMVGLFLSAVFTVGGVWLWIVALKNTTEPRRKLALQLTLWYALVGFVLLIPLAKEISLRFYLAMLFVPFVLLGLWAEAVISWAKDHHTYAYIALGIVTLVFVGTNLSAVSIAFSDHSGKKQIVGSTDAEITLGEVEGMAKYITEHFQSGQTIYVRGKQTYLFKYLKSIEYFTLKSSVVLKPYSKNMIPSKDDQTVLIANAINKGKLTKSMAEAYDPIDIRIFGRFSIEQIVLK